MNLDSYVDVTQDQTKIARVIKLKKRNTKSVTQQKNFQACRNQSEIIDSNTVSNAYGNALDAQPQCGIIG